MNLVPLGDISRVTSERAGTQTGLPVFSVTKHDGFVRSDEYFRKQVFSRDLSNYKVVREGQLAYATIHLDEGSIGIAPEDSLVSPMYTSFEVNESAVSNDYLIRFLKSPRAMAAYPSLGKGSAERRRSIPFARLAELRVPLPPLDEQRRIAAILDKADELRTKRSEALAHLDSLTQSIFHAMFIEFAATTTLGEICGQRFRNGVSPSTRGSIQQRVLTLSAVTGSSFDPTAVKTSTFDKPIPDSNRVSSNLLLICRGNGNRSLVGKGYFPRADIADVGFPDTVIAVEPNTDVIDPTFLEASWGTPAVRAQLEAAAKTTNGTYKINQSGLSGVQLPLPPTKLQQTFAARAAAVERLRESHRKHLAELDALFASLQHRAFKGEL
ncbi:restriction endonuclease subunit S [Arthrobacter sp. SAFR-044]|uniref:restriction endonuclease subunit S n=1 Tax=Arthrobacter sp. SAFR-044 TaxID=3387278 RepID=UPI003F7BB7B6